MHLRTAANAYIIRRGPGSVVKPGGFRQERRLIADPGLWRRVLCWMRKGWSPEQCAGKLKA
jgi:hypothetical protein